MDPVLYIPIASPRRIESSNKMRFCNIRPPRLKVDFQSWTKGIIAIAVEEQKKKVPKKRNLSEWRSNVNTKLDQTTLSLETGD